MRKRTTRISGTNILHVLPVEITKHHQFTGNKLKMSRTALLCIDYINDIVHTDGKVSGKGYADFVGRHSTLEAVAKLQDAARSTNHLVIHVKVGFSPSYIEQNKNSPLTGKAHEFGALNLGEWGTEFHEKVLPKDGEPIIAKNRVNPFHATNLDLLLRAAGVDHLVMSGVSTDMAVEACARDAHDRDYRVTVISDCCAATSDDEHNNSLKTMTKFGTVVTSAEMKW